MTPAARDRDAAGRAYNSRPRDDLGRPLPYDAADQTRPDPELAALATADFDTLLVGAQRLLDAGRPFQAHELLEAAWKRAPAKERPLWRALAQLAVGITHLLRGNEVGANAVLTRSALQLRQYAPAPHAIDACGLAEAADRMVLGGAAERVQLTSRGLGGLR